MRHFRDVEAMVEALEPEDPVYCLRPDVLRRTAERFLGRFPGRVLYAVKANPAEPVLDGLYEAGIRHFDTASLNEIALVKRRYAEATAYFMHPVKGWQAIEAAWRDHGVRHFVVDHADEFDKVLQVLGGAPPDLVIMVRLATPGKGAMFDLSGKFGTGPEPAAGLLRAAAAAGARAGLCFHVGSQCTDPSAYTRALELSRTVLEAAGVEIACLDVGGGFPTAYAEMPVPGLEAYMEAIEAGLPALGLNKDCVIVCEPGRALVAEAMSLVAQVQLRRDRQLYINDGIYGTLHGASIGYPFPARLVRRSEPPAAVERAPFTIFGPTCDGLDVLPDPLMLPPDIRAGDWIELGMVGAYGNALRTGFNGFLPETFVTVDAPFRAAGGQESAAVGSGALG